MKRGKCLDRSSAGGVGGGGGGGGGLAGTGSGSCQHHQTM